MGGRYQAKRGSDLIRERVEARTLKFQPAGVQRLETGSNIYNGGMTASTGSGGRQKRREVKECKGGNCLQGMKRQISL